MDWLFRIAAGIVNPISLVAFTVAAIVLIVSKRQGPVPSMAWIVIAVLVLAALGIPVYRDIRLQRETAIYRVRATVVDPQGGPVENATVWSMIGGEPKKVPGGWQFDIPVAIKPQDGKLTIYARIPSAFLIGSSDLQLGADLNPTVTVKLKKEESASVRGQVIDDQNKAIPGVRVSVVGYESEAVITQAGGNFDLPAHAANGQSVQLHAEKDRYSAVDQLHPAGDTPATLILTLKGKKGEKHRGHADNPDGSFSPEESILLLYVMDIHRTALRGAVLSPKGDGSVSNPSDVVGRARIRLPPGTRPGQWITLQLVRGPSMPPPPWLLVSPFDGRVVVPSFENGPDNYVTVALCKRGEKIDGNSMALVALTANIFGETATASATVDLRDDIYQATVAKITEKFGLNPGVFDQSIRKLGESTHDPFEKALVALYEKDYSLATQKFSEFLQTRESQVEKRVAATFFLGFALYEQGKYNYAAEAYQKALSMRQGDLSIIYARGAALYKAGKYADTVHVLEQASLARFVPNDLSVEAKARSHTGEILKNLKQFNAALTSYNQALVIQHQVGNYSDEVATLNNIGVVYQSLGDSQRALTSFQRTLKLSRSLGSRAEEAKSLNSIGEIYSNMGAKYNEALSSFSQALSITEGVEGPDHLNIAIVSNNLAILYYKEGKYTQAEPLFKRAISIWEELSPKSPYFARSLIAYAALLRKTNREAEAAAKETRALEIMSEAPNTIPGPNLQLPKLNPSLPRSDKLIPAPDKTLPEPLPIPTPISKPNKPNE
jgi:tetratricopeptide (TPR) repeat protein